MALIRSQIIKGNRRLPLTDRRGTLLPDQHIDTDNTFTVLVWTLPFKVHGFRCGRTAGIQSCPKELELTWKRLGEHVHLLIVVACIE